MRFLISFEFKYVIPSTSDFELSGSLSKNIDELNEFSEIRFIIPSAVRILEISRLKYFEFKNLSKSSFDEFSLLNLSIIPVTKLIISISLSSSIEITEIASKKSTKFSFEKIVPRTSSLFIKLSDGLNDKSVKYSLISAGMNSNIIELNSSEERNLEKILWIILESKSSLSESVPETDNIVFNSKLNIFNRLL